MARMRFGPDDMAEHDPEGAKYVRAQAWQAMCDSAGVDRKTLDCAFSRVRLDGYDGPTSDEDWEEQQGEPMTMKRALKIVKDAADADWPVAKWLDPDSDYDEVPSSDGVDDDGTPLMEPIPNREITRAGWREEFFSWYREIYGGYP